MHVSRAGIFCSARSPHGSGQACVGQSLEVRQMSVSGHSCTSHATAAATLHPFSRRPLRDDETGRNQNTHRPKDSKIPTTDT